MKSASLKGLTLPEFLVLIVILLILASLTTHHGYVDLARGQMVQTLSNMKQLHLATLQWTLDNQTTGEESLVRWTSSNTIPLSFEQWRNGLVPEYLTESDMKKLLSYTKARKFWLDQRIEDIVSVFAVDEPDSPTTLLLATKNWHGLTSTNLSGEPYGDKGFIVFRKGGDGLILQQKKSADTNLIGTGGMHNYLPLK